MTTFGELITAFYELGVDRSHPVIVHASLSSLSHVEGGSDTVVAALLSTWDTLVLPTFTYKTMLTPEVGPQENGLVYGDRTDANIMAEFYSNDMSADRLMGVIPETLRRLPESKRSGHPILSFAGVNAENFLKSQTVYEPLAPIRLMCEAGGWVLLIGVDHTVNTSIHYAERLAGRKQFIRWSLTAEGVVECPEFPGCSDGFEALAPYLVERNRQVKIGRAQIWATPLELLIPVAKAHIEADPQALLCDHTYCERCQAVRVSVILGSNASKI
jgi:aminoglycoside 3-N-acetyltransferase